MPNEYIKFTTYSIALRKVFKRGRNILIIAGVDVGSLTGKVIIQMLQKISEILHCQNHN